MSRYASELTDFFLPEDRHIPAAGLEALRMDGLVIGKAPAGDRTLVVFGAEAVAVRQALEAKTGVALQVAGAAGDIVTIAVCCSISLRTNGRGRLEVGPPGQHVAGDDVAAKEGGHGERRRLPDNLAAGAAAVAGDLGELLAR